MSGITETFGSQAAREAAAQFDGDDSPLGDPIPGQFDLAGQEAQPDDPQPPVDEIVVAGTQGRLFDVGGRRPTSATVRLIGGEYKLLEGQGFSKGDVVQFSGTAVVREVGVRDEVDSKTGQVVSAKQKHRAEIIDLTVG